MGVLSDVIVASAAEAQRVLDVDSGARPWPWAPMKGIDHVKLGQLEAVFRGGAYDPGFVEACELLASADESVWVFRIPDILTDQLARLGPSAMKAPASEWAKAEEFALDRWTPQQVEEALSELASLAVKARATGKDLLLWMSL